MSRQPGLFDDLGPASGGPFAADSAARVFATDPRRNVVLEASAGTGKTSVLVQRYLNLLAADVDPANILAITFTRKAAAEMRERILSALRQSASQSDAGRQRWLRLRDRVSDIAISTIDAFCYTLLREFPLEAGLDPAFGLADETETARLVDEALDRALRRCRGIAKADPAVGLVLTRLPTRRLRDGLARLLDRRLVAPDGLARYLRRAAPGLDTEVVRTRAAERLRDAVRSVEGGLPRFLAEGPTASPRFGLVAADLRALDLGTLTTDGALWAAADTLRAYFLTGDGRPRTRMPGFVRKDQAPSEQAWRRHGAALRQVAPAVHAALAAWARDLNVLLAGGIGRIFAVALEEYRRTLAEHDVVDFPELLQRAVDLLRQMDDFSQSRYRLESRYHHVLLDEFQDTSRLQWQLVALLVQSWGEGFGLVHDAPLLPSLFIVGDRKQSIYRFRDADVTLLDEAAAAVGALRPEGDPRRYISRSFRAKPALLAFVNDVCTEVATGSSRPEAFLYREADRFPLEAAAADAAGDAAVETARDEACVRVIAGGEIDETASRVADEIARILAAGSVRDRATGLPREARAGDVAILFRSRDSHREFEAALEARGIPSYTYKGLGFFDADEIKDVLALVRFLAAPASDLRAAALLRSRFIRLSDDAIRRLAPGLSAALVAPEPPPASAGLEDEDGRVLGRARASVRDWLALVDRLPPDELIDHILAASAYAEELAGARLAQARENVKKIRALIRRIVNRGYATLGRLAAHIDRLSTGDEANAALEAVNAVSLMTVHAAKGLEFPIVFLVNLGRGVARRRSAIRVHVLGGHEEDASVAVDSFQSEADELEPELEREETKRLLYVALTRARDRLYLSTVLRDGAFRCGPGSLGSILPPSLGTVLQAAGSAPDGCALEWKGSSATHRCEVARPPAAPHGPVPRDAEPAEPGPDWPLLQPPMPRVAVTSLGRDGADPQGGRAGSGREDEEVDPQAVGRLVHELLRRVPPGRDISPNELLQIAAGLVPTGTGLDSAAAHAVAGRALDLYWKVTAASEFRELLREGVVEFEVPFTARSKDGLVRGVIDCLVRRRDGSVVVLEFKTGLHRPRHDRQLEVYVRALAGAVPGATGLLVRP